MINDFIGHSFTVIQNCRILGAMWYMGVPAAQPLPAQWVEWEKSALPGTQDSGSLL